MPFNGSGGFTRVRNWVADAAAHIKIKSDFHDQEDDNLASGLSNVITKDGQTTITADIPLNGKKLTNVGAPVSPTDASTKGYSDAATGLLAPKASPTFTGKVTLPTGSAAAAPINLPASTAVPTTPLDGDIWADAALGLRSRLAGVTYTYLRLEAAAQVLAGKIGLVGAAVAANSRSAVTAAGDISFSAGYNLLWNAFYDTVAAGFKTVAAGWATAIATDVSTGVVTILRSTVTLAAGAVPTWAALMQFDPVAGVTINGPAGLFKYNAGNVMVDNIDRLGLAAGFSQAAFPNDGPKSGAYTPLPAGGNIRYCQVNGALALTADPNASTAYTLVVLLANIAGAGAITTPGFSKVSGDAFDTTVNSSFMCYITKLGGVRTLTVEKIS